MFEVKLIGVEKVRKKLWDVDHLLRNLTSVLEEFAVMLLGFHQEAFNLSGHAGTGLSGERGGKDWAPTSPYWVGHMLDNTSKPLVWTGAAQKSLMVESDASHIELKAFDYLGLFQFGPFSFKEDFYYVKDPDDPNGFLKLPGGVQKDVSGMSTDGPMPSMFDEKTTGFPIKIKEREVFRVDPSDARLLGIVFLEHLGLEWADG